ncbi:MAG: hypothetical protein ABW061_04075 [Polyangiaceae bacterium]
MSRTTGLRLVTAFTTLVLGAACGSSGTPSGAGPTPPSGAGAAGAGQPTPGAGAPSSGSAGATGVPGAGAGGLSSSTGGAPSGAGGSAGSGGGLPLPVPTNSDHCLYGYSPEATDDTMKSGPARFTTSSGDDTILQPEVLKWMDDNKWTGAHVIWHAVRGCVDGSAAGLLSPLGFPNVCKDYPVLIPSDQNCKTAGDGYQFLLFHRHMLQSLKQLWPKHAADFDGFPKFPTTKADLPDVWNTADPKWSAQILAAAQVFDNIEQNLDKFPNEGALGFALQCPTGTKLISDLTASNPYIGIHFDLHNQWSRGASSPHGLNNGQVNVTNYMFWKLHGWIDNIWEKYRVAKGLTTDPAAMETYKRGMTNACNEMDIEEAILKQSPGSGPVLDCPPDVDETGDFHTKVRPIFETATNHCASCHGPSQSSPYASLTLGGQVSSKCIVERLKRASNDGGQFKLIEPGDPDKSYLYLKASGKAADSACVSSDPAKPCNTATMPPGGKTMSDAELTILHDWIAAGANYP